MSRMAGAEPQWPAIFGPRLAKTKIYFTSSVAELVAEQQRRLRRSCASSTSCALSRRRSRPHLGRELVLGYVAHRAGSMTSNRRWLPR